MYITAAEIKYPIGTVFTDVSTDCAGDWDFIYPYMYFTGSIKVIKPVMTVK